MIVPNNLNLNKKYFNSIDKLEIYDSDKLNKALFGMFDINTLREIYIISSHLSEIRSNGYFPGLLNFESFDKQSFLKLETVKIHNHNLKLVNKL